VPMLGLHLALVWTLGAAKFPADVRRAWPGVAVTALAACAILTWRQLGVWRNSYTLFDHAIAVTRDNYLAHDNRGLFQFRAGKVEEAMADYRRALAINPAYLNAHNNLGYAL